MSKGPKQTFSQTRHTNGQQIHGKVLTSPVVREVYIKTIMKDF